MYNLVKIGGKDVPLLCMASTDVYYRHIFGADPIKELSAASEGDAIGIFQRLGFVMAKFAETKDRKEMLKLNEENYLDWLDGFDRAELMNALEDIQKTYLGQNVTSAEAKKNNGEPSEA